VVGLLASRARPAPHPRLRRRHGCVLVRLAGRLAATTSADIANIERPRATGASSCVTRCWAAALTRGPTQLGDRRLDVGVLDDLRAARLSEGLRALQDLGERHAGRRWGVPRE